MKSTTYWAMKKQVAQETQDATVHLMETTDFVVWADNYAHCIGHVIATAEKGSFTCAAFTGKSQHWEGALFS